MVPAPVRGAASVGKAVGAAVGKVVVVALGRALFPRKVRALRYAAICYVPAVTGHTLPEPVTALAKPLQGRGPRVEQICRVLVSLGNAVLRPFAKQSLALTLLPCVLKVVRPGQYRACVAQGTALRVASRYLFLDRVRKPLLGMGAEREARVRRRLDQWGAAEARAALLSLRGAYLKAGQVLATKRDLVPPAYITGLSGVLGGGAAGKGCDQRPFREVQRQVAAALGEDVARHLQIDPLPVASASVAQVHAGTHGGCKVALKVVHRGSRDLMLRDLRTVAFTLSLPGYRGAFPRDAARLLREYSKQLANEFDLEREGRLQAQIREALLGAGITQVVIPQPVAALAGPGVVVMSFEEGLNFADLARTEAEAAAGGGAFWAEKPHMDLHPLARAYGHMLLVQGLMHADPHPGNLALRQDGSFVVYDWGLVAEVGEPARIALARMVIALAEDAPDCDLASCLGPCGVSLSDASNEEKARFARLAFDTAGPVPASGGAGGKAAAKVVEVGEEMVLILRAIQLLRGLVETLDCPSFSLAQAWEPFAVQCLRKAGLLDAVDEKRILARNQKVLEQQHSPTYSIQGTLSSAFNSIWGVFATKRGSIVGRGDVQPSQP